MYTIYVIYVIYNFRTVSPMTHVVEGIINKKKIKQ